MESQITPELSAFVAHLEKFFGTSQPAQIDFLPNGETHLARYQAGSDQVLNEVISTSAEFPHLPVADGGLDTLFNLGSLARLGDFELSAWLSELRRVIRHHLWIALDATPGRDRTWWENCFIEAGFRKHALNQCIVPYEELGDETHGILLLLDVIPPRMLHRHSVATLRAERGLHMDMLREGGIRSDAHLARYILARDHVRAGQVVVDAACGLGYGCATLATKTDAARIIGIDLSKSSVAYARDIYGPLHPNLSFFAQDATKLHQIADASVDLAVSFETLEHMPNPELLLREFARVLKPGGTFIGSVPNLWMNEHGHNPVPYHLHIYDHAQLHEQVARYFTWTALYRQNAGGGWKRLQPRILQAIPNCVPSAEDCRDAEWWIAVATKPGA